MSHTPKTPKPSPFSAYGELIRGLLSGVASVSLFNVNGRCRWCSDKTTAAKERLTVIEALRTGRNTRHAETQELVTYAIPLRDRHDVVGVLAVSVSVDDSDTWDMTIERIEIALKPVIAVLTQHLARPAAEPKSTVLTERTEELEWLFSVTAQVRGGSSDVAAVEQLIEAAGKRIGAAYGGLAVIDKGINVTYAAGTCEGPAAAVAYEQIHPHLMTLMQRQRKPLVVNKPTATSVTANPQKILAVPIASQQGDIRGFIAFLKSPTAVDFGRRDQYLVRHIARQVAALLDSQYDLATGLLTRVAFEQQVNQQLDMRGDGMHSIVYADIDEMHVINEHFGYAAGDEIIVRIADALRPPLLPSDAITARIAGDRFLVYLPDHDADRAHDCAAALQRAITTVSIGSGQQRLSLSLSCGVSRVLRAAQPVARAIAAAELACKTAKDRGRNRCEVYLDADESMLRRRSDITGLGMLKDALKHERLVLYTQQIVSAHEPWRTTGIECTAHIVAANGKLIPPAEYLPVAQRYKLCKQIDEWVIRNALSMVSPYSQMLLHAEIQVAINISAQSLADKGLYSRLASWIRGSRLAPGRITFEINEAATASNLALTDSLIERLQPIGCRFAIDGFGTGLNSLAYLRTIKVQCIKIDGSFVRDVDTNPRSAAMVRAMVELAKSLNIDCVADLVTSGAILHKLRDLGVDQVQGTYLHEPQTLRAYLENVTLAESQRVRAINEWD